jgi:hypothetical protein
MLYDFKGSLLGVGCLFFVAWARRYWVRMLDFDNLPIRGQFFVVDSNVCAYVPDFIVLASLQPYRVP